MGWTSFFDETENGPVVIRVWTAGTSNVFLLSVLITKDLGCALGPLLCFPCGLQGDTFC